MALSLASLLIQETKDAIYNTALSVAESVGLPVTTWQSGDPTRSLYHVISEVLATLEGVVALYTAAGFLDYATGDWLKLLAKQAFNVDAIEATFATTTVTLTNGGGGLYTIEAGDLTFKNSTTGETYRNTTGGTLPAGPGTSLGVTVIADEAGSDSSAAATEIDELVTVLLGVTCSNPTAAIGIDEESEDSLRERCRDKLASISPNGPRDAYSYVARNSDLTGTSGITRVRVFSDSDTGDVTVYLAGPSGGVSTPDRDAAEDAIITWATPLCITPNVATATGVTIPVTYTLWLYQSVGQTFGEVQGAVSTAIGSMFAARPIGGDIIPPALTGSLYKSMVESTIRATYPNHAFRVTVSAPSGDTALANNEVAVLGTIAETINFVENP